MIFEPEAKVGAKNLKEILPEDMEICF